MSISGGVFYGCHNLTSITIPDSVTSIGSVAFVGCFNLTSVCYTGDLASWCNINFTDSGSNPLCNGKHLYINNELVTGLVIPDTVTEIKDCAFAGYTSLTSVTMGNNVTSTGFGVFQDCQNLTSVKIGNSVTTIGEASFRNCKNITSVTIPDSVTTIDRYVFYGCSGLKEIKFNGNVAQWNAIEKDSSLNVNLPATKVICTNGEVKL